MKQTPVACCNKYQGGKVSPPIVSDLLLGTGLICFIVGHLLLVKAGKSVSTLWAFFLFIMPGISWILFAPFYWRKAKWPLLIAIVGFVFLFIASKTMPMQ
ncbi:MAG: hypothetical protein D3916_11085 [Candidatus Electrothrix sp. MAN1_4]|nr:hypothetical protein [Candidatus Electrothrix sp. MAN1_4]